MKRSVLVLTLILTLLFSLLPTYAATLPGTSVDLDKAKQTLDGVPKTQDELKEVVQNKTTSYLKQQWMKYFKESKFFGPLTNFYLSYISPSLKYVFGMEPEISWLFLVSLIIWLILLNGFYQSISSFSSFSETPSFLIALGLSIILGVLKVSIILATPIVWFIGLYSYWWAKIIIGIVLVIILILAVKFFKSVKAYIRLVKKQRKEEEAAMTQVRLKASAKNMEKMVDSINNEVKIGKGGANYFGIGDN